MGIVSRLMQFVIIHDIMTMMMIMMSYLRTAPEIKTVERLSSKLSVPEHQVYLEPGFCFCLKKKRKTTLYTLAPSIPRSRPWKNHEQVHHYGTLSLESGGWISQGSSARPSFTADTSRIGTAWEYLDQLFGIIQFGSMDLVLGYIFVGLIDAIFML